MTEPAPGARPVGVPPGEGSWWRRHRKQVLLILALFAAATAPIWGGLILLWLLSPTSPFPQP
ncbi:MAG TPA: hypothetical protein VFL59_00450 [Candidatus Nanopelagicales bacterium]|nr:hypothetical protein [Candidatus Nanopelagicales bacterium]